MKYRRQVQFARAAQAGASEEELNALIQELKLPPTKDVQRYAQQLIHRGLAKNCSERTVITTNGVTTQIQSAEIDEDTTVQITKPAYNDTLSKRFSAVSIKKRKQLFSPCSKTSQSHKAK